MLKQITYWSIIILFLGPGCQSVQEEDVKKPVKSEPVGLSGEIHVSGAQALYPLVKTWAEDFMQKYPGVDIRVSKTSTGQGISDVISGNVDLAMMTSEYTDEGDTARSKMWKIAVAKGAVVPIINDDNPYRQELMTRGITKEILVKLFTMPESETWGGIFDKDTESDVSVLIRDEMSGATNVWARYLDCSSNALKGEIIPGDESMVEGIQENPLAIGYCNSIYAYDINTDNPLPGICILPIDFNGNGRIDAMEKYYEKFSMFRRSVCIGKYTRGLCITLYIVSDEKPVDETTLAFLRWILSEGQQTIENNGYAKVPGFVLGKSLLMLE